MTVPSKLKAWSFSSRSDFEQCKYRVYLKQILKLPEPPRPLPPGKTEHANDRGTRVHRAAELYVQGGTELIPELAKFEPELVKLKKLYGDGKVAVEGEWAFNREWGATAWKSDDAWCRMKVDVFVHVDPRSAVVIDLKTGRKSGNEVKHSEQGQVYQLAAFMRFPDLEAVDVEFWYTDVDDLTRVKYTRQQGLRFFKSIDSRGQAMTDCTDFPPSPSIYNCKWCPYNGNGCDRGVR